VRDQLCAIKDARSTVRDQLCAINRPRTAINTTKTFDTQTRRLIGL
jgi:hypothetical protein